MFWKGDSENKVSKLNKMLEDQAGHSEAENGEGR